MFIKMILFSTILFSTILFSTINTYGYNLSESDQKVVNDVKIFLHKNIDKKGINWYDKKILLFRDTIKKVRGNPRIEFVLTQIKNEMKNIVNDYYKIDQKYNQSNNVFKREFFLENGLEIVSGIDIPERCIAYYDFIDEIAYEYDFPTALIISTWKREYSCIFGFPNNGWGPFQITSSYYHPGEITLDEFRQSIIDFINFSKHKWDHYDNNPNLRERFGQEGVNLGYDRYSMRDLRLHSILYNGIRADTTLEYNTYANTNLTPDRSGARDGIVTFFLKLVNWEIDNDK